MFPLARYYKYVISGVTSGVNKPFYEKDNVGAFFF